MQIKFSKRFLVALKLSPEPAYKLALAAGLNPTSLSLMINGGRAVDPGDERIHRLAQLLGVERSEVFEEEGSVENP